MSVITNFTELNVPDFLLKSLTQMGITVPTPVQASAIPCGLEGLDILASAQTGTGKTMAYLIPLITRLMKSPGETALILTPTRELAVQVKDAAEKLLYKEIRHATTLLIGGEPMRKQLDALRRNPRLIIGTPGRINDHLSRHSLRLDKTTFFVIDEADRMLDMGFEEDLENIIGQLPKKRQTFMFSATMPPNIVKLSQKYLMNPQRISLGSTTEPSAQITQHVLQTTVGEKFTCLLKELDARSGSIIIFVKTKVGAENLADKLKRENLSSEIVPGNTKPRRIAAIHGDLRQSRRNQVISAFRDRRLEILVATDVAARGLDIHHVRHVINYDLPQCPDDYVHRIGRTGRAGLAGEAVSLLLPADRIMWRRINDFIQQKNGGHASEPFQKRGRSSKPYQRSVTTSFRSRPSARFASEGSRFGGDSTRSGSRRTPGGGFAGSRNGDFGRSEGGRRFGNGPGFGGSRNGSGVSDGRGEGGRRFGGGAGFGGWRNDGGASAGRGEGGRRFGGSTGFAGGRNGGGTSVGRGEGGRRFANSPGYAAAGSYDRAAPHQRREAERYPSARRNTSFATTGFAARPAGNRPLLRSRKSKHEHV